MRDRSSPNPAEAAVSRRRLFAGAGTVGALAATAAALPMVKPSELPSAEGPAEGSGAQGGGYRLTAHVQRYYQTTKV